MKYNLKVLTVLALTLFGATFLFAGFVREAGAGAPSSGWITDRLVYGDPTNDERRPAIATASNGSLYMAYEHENPATGHSRIYISRSDDGGNTWTYLINLQTTGYDLHNPSIAIDVGDNNNLFVAYELERSSTNHDINVWRFVSGSWSLRVVDRDLDDDRFPSITSEYWHGTEDYQYISYEYLYSNDDRDLMFAKSTDDGDTWAVSKLLGGADDLVHCMSSITTTRGSDGNDYIYIAIKNGYDYTTAYDVFVAVSSTRGDSWTWKLVYQGWSPRTRDVQWPSIAATHGGGTVVVAWHVYYDALFQEEVQYAFSLNNGLDWGWNWNWLAMTLYRDITPALTVDGQGSTSTSVYGYVHVVWWSFSMVKYKKAYYTSLPSWSSDQTVNSYLAASSTYSKPTITTQYRSDGGAYYPCVAWTDHRGASNDVYYSTPGATYTIESNLSGRTVEVDGNPYTTSTPFNWIAGYSHTVNAPSPQYVGSDTRYVYTSWSDGGAQSHDIIVGTTDTTLTANFQTQFLITVNSAHDSPTPSQWVDQGGSLTVSVTSPTDDDGAGTRYRCTGYKIDDGSLQAGTSYTFTDVQAPHKIEFEWTTQYRLIVTSAHDSPNPSGENWYDSGTSITASVTSPREVADTRYKCTGWDGTGSAPATGTTTSTTFTITAPSSITWNWVLHQYRITFTQSGPETGRSITITVNGNPHTGTTTYTYSEWIDKDSSATFSITDTIDSATTGKRYALKEWKNNAGTVITSPQTIIGPNTFTANYKTQYSLTVNTNPTDLTPQPSLTPSGTWHDAGTSVTCTAPTVNGYTFDHWTLDGTSKGTGTNPITVSIDKAHTATAYYTAIPGANPPPTAVTLSEPSDINQTSMKLTWTQNNEADFARYEIYQSNASGTLGTKIHETTDRSTTSYNVTELTADTTYYFTIKVVDTSGQSTDSNQVTGKTQAETAPTPVWMLWVIGGIIAALVVVTVTMIVWFRRKK